MELSRPLKIGILLLIISQATGSYIIEKDGNDIREVFTQELSFKCPESFTGLLPHPVYCHFYYFCDNGVEHLRECPADLYFNPPLEACDYPSNIPECQGGTWPPENPSPTTEWTTTPSTTTSFPEPSSDTPVTEPTVPPSSSSTPSTTTWSTSTTTSTTSIPTTNTPPPTLSCPDSSIPMIHYPYPGQCSRYFRCEYGIITQIDTCIEDLWFRFSTQVCQTPWGPDCTE